jgi:uncharacterized RDD family membrane protein YckC
MTCQYCTAKNDPEDSRCQRCGRRIHSVNDRSTYHRAPVMNSSLAHSLSYNTDTREEAAPRPTLGPQIVPPPTSAPEPSRAESVHQASLFGPQEVLKKVHEAPRRALQSATTFKPRADRNAQGSLDFIGGKPLGNHALRTSVEARIYCNAPIAQTPLRVMAALADTVIGLVGLGVYALTFRVMGQEIAWTNSMIVSYLAAAFVIAILYRVLFCLGNGDTPGMRWVGLRVMDFDGRSPSRRQRFQRLAGGFVGVLAVGLGLLWALYDEEKLTWHDQMSETFPTVRD